MNDPFKSPKRPWHREKEKRPAEAGRHDVKFYKRSGWPKIRQQKLWHNPYCEVSEAYGRLEDGEHVDHIVPRSQGGSDIDPRNLMTLTREIHGKKSGLERIRGCLVQTKQSHTGLVPADKNEIIELLGKQIWGREPDEGAEWG